MTPKAYCERLASLLSALPDEERQDIVHYYREFLEDAEEAERQAIGTPEQLAERILKENLSTSPSQDSVQNVTTESRGKKAIKILLLILSSPIWLSLLLCWFAILLALLITAISISLSLAATFLVGIFNSIVIFASDISFALFVIGCSLICGGLFILLWKPLIFVCKQIGRLAYLSVKKPLQLLF
jgi:uncharacterized membrane protein